VESFKSYVQSMVFIIETKGLVLVNKDNTISVTIYIVLYNVFLCFIFRSYYKSRRMFGTYRKVLGT